MSIARRVYNLCKHCCEEKVTYKGNNVSFLQCDVFTRHKMFSFTTENPGNQLFQINFGSHFLIFCNIQNKTI